MRLTFAHAILLLTGVTIASVAVAEDELFDRLGGEPGIARIVSLSTRNFLADDRIRAEFDNINMDRLQTMLTTHLCVVAGGTCTYRGRPMADAHRGLAIDRAKFNAVAEDLQAAMEEVGVPYRIQNRLLARLAPMQRDIVTR